MFTLDLLADIQIKHPDITVCGENYLPVHHCLLSRNTTTERKLNQSWRNVAREDESPVSSGRVTPTTSAPTPEKPRSKPLTDLKHIRKLYSHPQAWGQCKIFLAAYLRGIECIDVSSTSRAAEIAAADDTGTSAAISSRLSADINGLQFLAENIEDDGRNATRFFILSRRQDILMGNDDLRHFGDNGTQDHKSLVLFTVSHDDSGALADCLAVFKKHSLNLTSINTRPSREAPWHYIFFVELKGRKLAEAKGGAVNDALHDLEKVATSSRWLGSWKNALLF